MKKSTWKKWLATAFVVLLPLAAVRAQSPTAYALWCEDNSTLYFTNSSTPLILGGTYDGQTITNVWSGTNVTAAGGEPGWTVYCDDVTSVVFDQSFQNVLPTSTSSWFQDFSQLTSIIGLQYLNTSAVTDMSHMFKGCESLTSLDVTGFITDNVTDMSYMFESCRGLTNLNVSGFNTTNVTDMQDIFSCCRGLSSLDITNWNTSNVTSFRRAFADMTSLTTFDVTRLNTSSATTFGAMFCGDESLTVLDLRNFDITNVTNVKEMFSECENLTTIYCNADWNTGSITNHSYLFEKCDNLVGGNGTAYESAHMDDLGYAHPDADGNPGYFTVPVSAGIAQVIWTEDNSTLTFLYSSTPYVVGETYNGQTITAVWSGADVTATGNDRPGWSTYCDDVESVVFDESFQTVLPTSTAYWFDSFSQITSITDIQYLNTSEVTDMDDMFDGCSSLTSIDVTHFDTSNVTEMSNMFQNCSSLTSLDLTSFDTSNNRDTSNMFENCSNLQTIYCNEDWNTSGVYSTNMFWNCTSLVGGNGTEYDSGYSGVEYAHPDADGNPGYFTLKTTEKIPYAIFCLSGISDEYEPIMYFTYSSETYAAGDTYDGKTITYVWSGTEVTDYGNGSDFAPWSGTIPVGESNPTVEPHYVVFDESFEDVRPTSCRGWFKGANKELKAIQGLEYLNTSEVTDMAYMFNSLSHVTELDLSTFDTSKVTDMASMFKGCTDLETLDLSQFETGNVTDMSEMFSMCTSLTTLDLSNFDTENVEDMEQMFFACESLTELDLNNFNTSNVTKMSLMFTSCEELTTIYCGNDWNTANITDGGYGMFYGCSLLVGGNGTAYADTFDEDPSMFEDPDNVRTVGIEYAHPDAPGNPGYFTVPGIPQVVWTAGNSTLTFLYSTTEYAVDDDFGGYPVTKVWSGTQVTNSGMVAGWSGDVIYSHEGVDEPKTDPVYINIDPSFQYAYPTTCDYWFADFHHLTDIQGMEYLKTSRVTSMRHMFKSSDLLTSLDLSTFDTSNVTDMTRMFGECSGLTSIDVSNFDTSNVIAMPMMFQGCEALTSLDVSHFDTSNVMSFTGMFIDCRSLTSLDVSNFDTSALDELSRPDYDGGLSYMFTNCTSLETLDLSNFDTSNAKYLVSMFTGCENLTSITFGSGFDTSNVTEMSAMFAGCTSLETLDLSIFDTSSVTDMFGMFAMCSSLETLDLSSFDTSSATNMAGMFYGCSALEALDVSNFDTSNVIAFTVPDDAEDAAGASIFMDCPRLQTIITNDDWQTDITYQENMFYGSESIVGEWGATYDVNNLNSDYANPNESGYFTKKIETLTANAYDGKYYTTYYNSYVGSLADDNTTVYKAVLVDRMLTLVEIEDKVINPGEAVILESTNSTISLTRQIDTLKGGEGDYTESALSGRDKQSDVPTDEGTIYTMGLMDTDGDGVKELGFFKFSGTSLKARKAYLALPASTEAGFRFNFEDGEATGITEMEDVQNTKYNEVFDLSGRRVAQPTKGLYIVNGKKVYMK